MCGIAGYIGKNQASIFLISALKRLEYRGYDSAGIAVLDSNNKFNCIKSVGKVRKLEKKISNSGINGFVGISHTRWATHGCPSEANTHPHSDCKENIFVAHNGIIENYKFLKERLIKAKHKFKSETDTEVISHLIESHFQGNLEKAVLNASKHLEGAYAIVVVCKDNPEKIVAIRKGSPLVIGIGEDEYFIASDPSAIAGYVNDVIYLDDDELAVVGKNYNKVISTVNNNHVHKDHCKLNLNVAEIKKGGYSHFMLKEIFECPEAVKNSIRGRVIPEQGLVKLGGLEVLDQNELRNIERIMIIACGTANFAGLIGEYMLEEYVGIPCEVEIGSEFRYREPVINSKTAVIAISQSGETADTIASLLEAKRKGALTLGIVNVVGSTIARETKAGVYNHAGPEIAVASTKAFISQIIVLSLMTVYLGRMRNMSLITGRQITEEIIKIPSLIEKALKNKDKIKSLAEKYSKYKDFLFLGRKYNYPIAEEGALKLKEVVYYVHAEGYPSGELKHGPIAMIDKNFPSFFITPKDSVYVKNYNNMEEIKSRNGKIIAITTTGNKETESIADDVIYVPKTLEMLAPILSVIPIYLFAAYMGIKLGCDIDKPRNLAKTVTVE